MSTYQHWSFIQWNMSIGNWSHGCQMSPPFGRSVSITRRGVSECPGRFLGTIGQHSSNMRLTFLKSWTSTGDFSNSTGSSVTSGQFSLFIGFSGYCFCCFTPTSSCDMMLIELTHFRVAFTHRNSFTWSQEIVLASGNEVIKSKAQPDGLSYEVSCSKLCTFNS